VAKLVTAVQVVQTSMAPVAPTVLNLPAIQLATRESEAEVQVIAPSVPAAFPTTVVHVVHTSVAPAAPAVLKALVAQAETRLSEADVQVTVAPVAALATAVQAVQTLLLSHDPPAQAAVQVVIVPYLTYCDSSIPTVFFTVAEAAHPPEAKRVAPALMHLYVAPVAAPTIGEVQAEHV
tara:strand:+ start:698 stop:1231 length:534 start_codon:yes stop_codon:yes gene_type:complete